MANTEKAPVASRLRTKPTPEQIASLREERERKRQLKAEEEQAKLQLYGNPLLVAADDPRGAIMDRKWVDLTSMTQGSSTTQRVRIKTWNLLAQCLVRRKLFPESDCLKSHEREHMLYHELLNPRADIICLQETDRLEKILPLLEAAGYKTVYAAGPRKKHGCLIAFSADMFESAGEIVVHMDDADRGASFRTKNIGSLVGLRSRQHPGKGFVVATTHLFWHPSYTYERTRQAGILLREATRFRDTYDTSWPCILAGDFNFAPDDVAYALLVGMPLLPQHKSMLARSRVVHTSIDPSVPVTTRKMIGSRVEESVHAPKTSSDAPSTNAPSTAEDDDDDEGGTDPDKAITNAREARPEDGLLSTDDLSRLFAQAGAPVISLYNEAQRLAKAQNTCGPRLGLPPNRLGYHEPEWTSYTHYWKTVLDYIYVTTSKDNRPVLMGYLQPPTTEQLQPGIPLKGVTGSDHVSLTIDVAWK